MTPEEQAAADAAKAAEDAKADEVPSWAQQLIDQNADLTTRLESFEEKLTPVVEEPAQYQEPITPPVWKPKSFEEIVEKAKDETLSVIQEQQAQAKAEQDAQAAAAGEVDSYLDAQIAELAKDNKLPAVTNENDPNDPGKLAQRELYGFALSLGTADLKTSYNVLDSLHKAGKKFDFVKMELVESNPAGAGANSPVGSSSAGASGATATRPDYATLNKLSLDQLAARFGSQ